MLWIALLVAALIAIVAGPSLVSGAKWLYRTVAASIQATPQVAWDGRVSVRWLLAFVLAAVLVTQMVRWQGCSLPALPTWNIVAPKVTAVTYVYEQRATKVPSAVRAGLSKLNERDILATEFDKDTLNKQGGEVPEQYKVPLAAAKKLPSLVVTDGSTVIRVVENPQTEDDVLKAAQ